MGNAVGSVALWMDVGVRQKIIFLLDTGSGFDYVNTASQEKAQYTIPLHQCNGNNIRRKNAEIKYTRW
ncbi:hypothetical protein B7P43_G08878 [Cryptotermes secundus]|uniref:Uncharacterized protein n=1 Tax=Cryptotermes secundus TaxID=105785 RepID=A0A2J7R7N4_9NEOP|nr:hypothetical protein B7P43_G08878 [Cryptotermes secundus]